MPRGVTTTIKEQNVSLNTVRVVLTHHGTQNVLDDARRILTGKSLPHHAGYQLTGVYMDRQDRIIGIAERVEEHGTEGAV